MPPSRGDFIIDGFTELTAGMNSGTLPQLLPLNQAAFATNTTFRGGFATHRPPFRRLVLNFNKDDALQVLATKNLFQGACFYNDDFGGAGIVAAIGGNLFQFKVDGNVATVTNKTIPGDPNPPTAVQAWLWQAERWVIWNDGQSLPVFYDVDAGTSRRSQGASKVVATTTGFTAPAVGATVAGVALTAPYTGPYNVPVLVITATGSAATYVIKQNGVIQPNATVEVLYDPSASVPSGSQLLTIPSRAGIILGWGFFPPTQQVSVTLLTSTPPLVGDVLSVAGGTVRVHTAPTPGAGAFTWNFQTAIPAMFEIVPPVVAPGTIALNSSPLPNSVVGTTQASFVPPAQYASSNIKLDVAYSGAANQQAWFGNGLYLVSPLAVAPAVLVDLQNLNDTSAAVYPNPTDLLSIPELPAGRMGTYGMGRVWESLIDGKSFMAGDIVGGSSGSPLYQNRDAVLRSQENGYLAGGGNFVVPGTVGDIRFMRFTATLDASLGQGPLQVGTPNTIFSCQSPVDRLTWQALTNPILTESLITNGGLGQNASIVANGDIVMRSIDGIRSLVLARRDFATWGNVPQSREVQRVVDLDDTNLLQYASAIVFDNRLLMTALPQSGPLGTFHNGLYALNFDPISTLRGKAASIYDGLFTGVNVLQLVNGIINGVQRALAFTYNTDSGSIELWEILTTNDKNSFDNDSQPIAWSFETATLFQNVKGKGKFDQIELLDCEIYLKDLRGVVNFQTWYRSSFSNCWVPWLNFNLCANNASPALPGQQRVRVGLGEPDISACDPTTNRPYRIGESFQFRIQVSGEVKIMGAQFKAKPSPDTYFSVPHCDPLCITEGSVNPEAVCEPCTTQGVCLDFPIAFYTLGKTYTNLELSFFKACANGTLVPITIPAGTIIFTLPFPPGFSGPYPPIVMLCQAGGYIVRQIPDNATQSQIDDIVNEMISTCAQAIVDAAPTPECPSPAPPNPPPPPAFVTLIIKNYFDGYIANPTSFPDASPAWTGKFVYKNGANGRWFASDSGFDFTIQGLLMCQCTVQPVIAGPNAGKWFCSISNAAGADFLLWEGFTPVQPTPIGIYTRTDGYDAAPASIEIISNPDPVQPTSAGYNCGPG